MAELRQFEDIVNDLRRIKKQGYHKTVRSGNTGVGATLESLLGIKENNIAGPNGDQTELKSKRKKSAGMLTLFTKSPSPRGVNRKLVEYYGKPSSEHHNQKILHTTVDAHDFNSLYEKPGFKISMLPDAIKLVHKIPYANIPTPYWTKKSLEDRFTTKYPRRLLYVRADSRGTGTNEEFFFNEAYVLSGFSFKKFLNLLAARIIYVDIRIGTRDDGKIHDHGTGFRLDVNNLDQCFSTRHKIALS